MSELSGGSVRITAATPLADLLAVVWPGVTTIYHPRTETAGQIQALETHLTRLERLRGIRPRSVNIVPTVETPKGVSAASEIASSSVRITAFGVGPNLWLGLGLEPDAESADALLYARAECELHARALGLQPVDIRQVLD